MERLERTVVVPVGSTASRQHTNVRYIITTQSPVCQLGRTVLRLESSGAVPAHPARRKSRPRDGAENRTSNAPSPPTSTLSPPKGALPAHPTRRKYCRRDGGGSPISNAPSPVLEGRLAQNRTPKPSTGTLSSPEGPVLSSAEGPVLSKAEGPVLSSTEGRRYLVPGASVAMGPVLGARNAPGTGLERGIRRGKRR